jgi:dTDP-4-dehydrorhamnose 3,5-epimerase
MASSSESVPMATTEILPLEVPGAFVVRPAVHRDARGFFLESWSARAQREAGLDLTFVQDNHSRSRFGTLRGLHYQAFGGDLPGQAKLVRVARGKVYDVLVDLRRASPTFGRFVARELDDEAHEQLFVPAGCAHGFVVLSEVADVLYKVSTPYDPATERGLAWDDPELAIPWPVAAPLLSERDRLNPSLSSLRGGLA